MTLTIRLLSFLVGFAVLMAAACGGGDGEGEAKATPKSTSTVAARATAARATTPADAAVETPRSVPVATETPVATPTMEEAPHAGPIAVEPGVNNLGEGVIEPVVAAGGVFNLDPLSAAEDLGISAPPCAALLFYLTWQVREPFPPEGVDLELYWTRMGGSELVGEGPSGQASRGCGEIQVRNNSAFEVTVEIRYAIGETSG